MKKMILVLMVILLCGVSYAADNAYIRETLLNQDPDPAEPGEYVELRWNVEKFGNDELQDIKYELKPEYPFFFDGSDQPVKELDDWIGYSDDDEYYTLYYKLKVADDAVEDTYDIKLAKKHDKLRDWATSEFDIRVGDAMNVDLTTGSIVSSPMKLVSDLEEAELDVEISNIGDEDAEAVKVELALPEGFDATYSYSDLDNLGTIEQGSSKTATFYIDVDEDVDGGKAYQAVMEIRYKDDDDVKQVELPLELNIKDKPDFEVTGVRTVPEVVHPGDMFDIYVTVENVGGKKGESVSVRAFKDSTQPLDFEEKIGFIGTMEPGNTGEAVIKMQANEDASPKEYQLDIEIRSVEGDKVLIQEDSLTFEIVNGEEKGLSASPLVGLGIVVLIAVAGIGIYFSFRRK